MKRSILLAALILGTAAPAFAADIPVKARPAPVVVDTWNWNGFYYWSLVLCSRKRNSWNRESPSRSGRCCNRS